MKKQRKILTLPKVRVIVDCRNGDLDRFIPKERAEELFEQGKLIKDLTNRAYAVPVNGRLIPELLEEATS